MKRLFTAACALLCSAGLQAEGTGDALLILPPADIHAAILEAATRVEAKFKGTRPEADGLAQQVADILATPDVPPPEQAGDLGRQRAAALKLLNHDLGASATLDSVRGYVFDSSPAGYRQLYETLEGEGGADDVQRFLRMKHAAKKLGWHDKEALCHQRALGAARALLDREPKNAAAHAWLAEVLREEDRRESWAATERALAIDPQQGWALHLRLNRRIHNSMESAVFRQPFAPNEVPPPGGAQRLYAEPLTEAEALGYGKRAEELKREAAALLQLAAEQHNLAAYLAVVDDLQILQQHANMVALAGHRPADMDENAFHARILQMSMQEVLLLFRDSKRLETALALATDDPEATGTIALLALMGDLITLVGQGKALPEERTKLYEAVLERMVAMAGADESLKAARAAEAACLIQWADFLVGRQPKHADMVLRTLKLDPFQHRSSGLLMILLSKQKDRAADYALAHIRLALVPDLANRRVLAATAVRAQDWAAAHRYLDQCLKEQPESMPLLNQRLATLLRENQSRATLKKAALVLNKIDSRGPEALKALEKEDVASLATNRLLLHAMSGQLEQARSELESAVNSNVLTEQDARRLRPLLEVK